ncbi:hypothetical protein DY000_02034043 [Brassica cretica]|uniref:Uncharacterized protein n=1 Tax=Brassica cretica TaxID=69181 RepID=A0ABQ7DU01_BRACR|nr:hypothetical protein DY000_02034043 [Brassica cretica]
MRFTSDVRFPPTLPPRTYISVPTVRRRSGGGKGVMRSCGGVKKRGRGGECASSGFRREETDGGVENGFGDAKGGASLVKLRGTEDTAEGFGGEREVRVMTSRGDCEAMLGEVVWKMGEAFLYFFFLPFLVSITSGNLSHRLCERERA